MRALALVLLATFAGCTADSSGGGTVTTSTSTGGFDSSTSFCCRDNFGGSTSGFVSQPFFPSTVSQPRPPAPVSGGTLFASRLDGDIVVVSDPDRDAVRVVNLRTRAVRTIALDPGDEPGHITEDESGQFHVVLRRAGQLLTVDRETLAATRRDLCVEPRGLTYRATTGDVLVACRGGELWTIPTGIIGTPSMIMLPDDLRDVVVDGNRVLVSRFRSAEIVVVEGGRMTGSFTLRPVAAIDASRMGDPGELVPSVAWRMVEGPEGGAVIVHQRARTGEVHIETPSGYGGGTCDHSGIVESVISVVAPGGMGPSTEAVLASLVLPVDVAVDATVSQLISVVAPGNALNFAATVLRVGVADVTRSSGACFFASESTNGGIPVATAISPNFGVVVQTRDPLALTFVASGFFIPLDDTPAQHDTGHQIFHANAGGGVACASCHPEGEDDGRTWRFTGEGQRRTPQLRFGIAGTEPFHWSGDLANLGTLMTEVFERRMGGPALSTEQTGALMHWLDALPPPSTRAVDEDAARRGRAIFERESVGCATCHTGAKLTNNQTVDVGTGGAFQVPSLVGLGWRSPLMHDGCAGSLAERFDAFCGGGEAHGHTAQLNQSELLDLAAYLQSL